MASPLRLWINAETGRLLANGSAFTQAQAPSFHVGDTVPLELHLIAGAGVATIPYEVAFPAGSTTKVAIGSVAGVPTSGQWRLSVSSTETADLAYNASASAVQTALNALSAVSTSGGVTVAMLGGGYSITWNTVGTKPAILAGSDTLAPASYEAIITLQAGGVSTREIVFVELRQNPVALASSFSPIGSPAVSVSTVSAWNGTNKVVRAAITNSPKSGYWTLTLGAKSYVFKPTSSAADIRNTLGVVCSDVSQTDYAQWDIALVADLAASVSGTALVASDALVGSISLSTAEAIAYIGSAESAAATIEILSEQSGTQVTLAQTACSLENALVAPGAIEPVSAGVVLTESVANNRFVRRDVGQSPSAADLDIIWPNLGVTLDGSDFAAALNASSSPSVGNPFVTLSQLPNQSLNTTSSPTFAAGTFTNGTGGVYVYNYGSPYGNAVYVTDGANRIIVLGNAINFPDSTSQNTAFIPADYLTSSAIASTYQTISGMSSYQTVAGMSSYLTTASASSTYLTISSASSTYLSISTASSTYALLTSFNQGVKTTDSPTFANLTIGSGGIITFPDSTTQATRVVQDTQANGSGFSTGGFDTSHYPYEVKVIDDTGTAYWVPARL